MLYFRDFHWLLVHGASRFHAYLKPDTRKREDVSWGLNLRYYVTGAAWRRVDWFSRPSVWLEIFGFRPPEHTWRDLENSSFWELPGDIESMPPRERGLLNFSFHPERDHAKDEVVIGIIDHVWRVATRDGRWLTVELALLSGSDLHRDELTKLPSLVTADGEEVSDEDATQGWKERAELYLIENVPFGTVTVRAPRNARDVETYALARAQEFIGGLDQPEHIQIRDHSKWEKSRDDLKDDIFVELHFYGQYQE